MTAPHDLVVIHLFGGNDPLNTVIPFEDSRYYDQRPTIAVHGDAPLPRSFSTPDDAPMDRPSIIPIEPGIGLHGSLRTIAGLYREGRVAVLNNIGYPDRDRSHFRSSDIWHTARPERFSNEGWLGRVAAHLDPSHADPALLVNVGKALPLAMASPGVVAASLPSLESYALFEGAQTDPSSDAGLVELARRLYEPAEGLPVGTEARTVGAKALHGIDVLASAPAACDDLYPRFNPLGADLSTIARIKLADVGTRVFMATHGGYDTHNDQPNSQARLFDQLDSAVGAFLAHLGSQPTARPTTLLIFSEFGRRVEENGGGTDHGGAGVAFVIGPEVRGGLYGGAPSLASADLIDGDLAPTIDFREVYTSLLDQFLSVDPEAVLDRRFDAPALCTA